MDSYLEGKGLTKRLEEIIDMHIGVVMEEGVAEYFMSIIEFASGLRDTIKQK